MPSSLSSINPSFWPPREPSPYGEDGEIKPLKDPLPDIPTPPKLWVLIEEGPDLVTEALEIDGKGVVLRSYTKRTRVPVRSEEPGKFHVILNEAEIGPVTLIYLNGVKINRYDAEGKFIHSMSDKEAVSYKLT